MQISIFEALEQSKCHGKYSKLGYGMQGHGLGSAEAWHLVCKLGLWQMRLAGLWWPSRILRDKFMVKIPFFTDSPNGWCLESEYKFHQVCAYPLNVSLLFNRFQMS